MNQERLAQRIQEVSKGSLASWNEFVASLNVPADIMPAIVTGRAELLRAMPARDLPAPEAAVLYQLIAGLLETNAALRLHAETIAQLVNDWTGQFKGLATLGQQINDVAFFRQPAPPADEDEG